MMPVISDQEFDLLRRLIREYSGVDLTEKKRALVAGRLARRLRYYNFQTYHDYYRFLKSTDGSDEIQVFIDLLTTHETHFFREPKHYHFLSKALIPEFEAKQLNRQLQVWSAAVSTGEEAYSLAMVISDRIGDNYEIFGSDVSRDSVARARQAMYPIDSVREIPEYYRKKYCLKGKGSKTGFFTFTGEIRKTVKFEQMNLLNPGNRNMSFDCIFLRNVLIYFDMDTKEKVILNLIPYLRKGGYLFLGHSETLKNMKTGLDFIQTAVYQKS